MILDLMQYNFLSQQDLKSSRVENVPDIVLSSHNKSEKICEPLGNSYQNQIRLTFKVNKLKTTKILQDKCPIMKV